MKHVSKDKTCPFCEDNSKVLDYKNTGLLLSFVDYFGKMKKSYFMGTCRKHQHALGHAIKKARHMGLMAFVR